MTGLSIRRSFLWNKKNIESNTKQNKHSITLMVALLEVNQYIHTILIRNFQYVNIYLCSAHVLVTSTTFPTSRVACLYSLLDSSSFSFIWAFYNTRKCYNITNTKPKKFIIFYESFFFILNFIFRKYFFPFRFGSWAKSRQTVEYSKY